MRVILLHNPKAGNGKPSARALKKLFDTNGHEIVYASTKAPDWEVMLREPADAVAIAGGDGTVSLTGLRVAQRGLPFCVLPLGTANNVAATLGEDRSTEEIVAGLVDAVERRVDLGRFDTRRGSQPFIESVGAGLLVELIHGSSARQGSRQQDPAAKRAAALKRLLKITDRYSGLDCELDLDGVKRRGRYLLIEILNMGLIGPNLPLAPRAEVGDGLLDVVCIEIAQRARWMTYVEQVCAGEDAALPCRPRRCRRVELRCSKPELHVDDEVFDGLVGSVEVDRAALRFLGAGDRGNTRPGRRRLPRGPGPNPGAARFASSCVARSAAGDRARK